MSLTGVNPKLYFSKYSQIPLLTPDLCRETEKRF